MLLILKQAVLKSVPNCAHVSKLLYSKKLNLNELLLSMPKSMGHTVELQKQRKKLKEKGQKYVPGTVSLQVLGSGAKGAPRSLYMFTDQSRYIFNCGEGTQRLAHEHKMKLSKLEHIFITHCTWENIGGLPGVALTIQDVGVPEITLHGPTGTDEIFAATRRFVVLKELSIKMAECKPSQPFDDPVMTVRYVPVKSSTIMDNGTSAENRTTLASGEVQQEDSEDDVDYYAHEGKRKLKKFKEDSNGRKKPKIVIKSIEPVAMCYICRLKPRPGALCLEKCVDKGVPPGPLLGKLKAGEDVTLADGTVVKSVDVRLPDDPGPVFIVVDCPDFGYLDSLINHAVFAQHQAATSVEEDVAFLVVHFTPQKVMEDPRYQEWMDKFSPSTCHLPLNESNTCMGSIAVHRVQHKLNLLHQGIFPLLQDKGTPCVDNLQEQNGTKEEREPIPGCVNRPGTFCTVHLRPKRCLDRKSELQLKPKEYIEETMGVEEFPEVLKELRTQLAGTASARQDDQQFPKLTFLGTGSCIPNKTRNTSGILLQTSMTDYMLMDCGEGTFGQLVRFFGPKDVETVLRGLKAVYISHLHADHHIGLIGLLKGRRRAGAESPLHLLAPRQIMTWLNLYHRCFEPITSEFILIPNGNLLLNGSPNQQNSFLLSEMLSSLNMKEVRTVNARHCPNSFGVAFTHNTGWKITYSGDTMPCSALVTLGQGSDIFIHEATMEDELVEEARVKMHSTTSEAIKVGQDAGARFIILTHFSQRYAKIPRINDSFTNNVAIAFDNMQVNLRELPLLPHMYKALRLMFSEHYEEMEQKTAKKLMRQERERMTS